MRTYFQSSPQITTTSVNAPVQRPSVGTTTKPRVDQRVLPSPSKAKSQSEPVSVSLLYWMLVQLSLFLFSNNLIIFILHQFPPISPNTSLHAMPPPSPSHVRIGDRVLAHIVPAFGMYPAVS